MKFDWNVYYYNYHDSIGNLNSQSQGVVKSNKFFPVFKKDNQDMIFKPLSKTKPLSTPYFAYSEVFWSTIINRYFDDSVPIYRLAICENIDNEFENKYHHGTIVNSIEKSDEKLVNSIYGHDCYSYNSESTHIYSILDGNGKFIIDDKSLLVKRGYVT